MLDPPTHLRQFDANCWKIRYKITPKTSRLSFLILKLSHAPLMVCSVYILGCMVVNINGLFAEWSITERDCFQILVLGFLLTWKPLFSDIATDAVSATFKVLVNTYFLNFRLALPWFCLLIVLRALAHLV